MALNVVTLPEALQERGAKLRDNYEEEECKKMVSRLIENLQYERTGRAIMDSIIMSDLSPRRFFDLLLTEWDEEDKLLSLYKTRQITDISQPAWQLAHNGFVGLQDKLMCMGCGGIALGIPEWCTMATVHAWLNPVCPSFLGEEPDATPGMELVEWPDLKFSLVREKLQKLRESSFHMYSKEYDDLEERRKTWQDNEDIMPLIATDQERKALAEAGWYVELHETMRTVRCFCCGVEIHHMRKDECPMMMHLLTSPVCPYMHAIMDEEDIKAVFAGHAKEINMDPSRSTAVQEYFQKIWFQPHIVSYERISWDKRSTRNQKETDKEKMRLVAEWLIGQRLKGYSEPPPVKKQKKTVTRKHLMRQYIWQAQGTDITTRANMPQSNNVEPRIYTLQWKRQYVYTPNWKRKQRHQQKWGEGTVFNRSAPLIEGDWLIMQQ